MEEKAIELIQSYLKNSKVCLNLSFRNLTVLPEEFIHISDVKRLLLNDNNLLIPPSEIAIFSETLIELILCNNNLTVFPSDLGKLKNLQILDVSFNSIGVLPSEIGSLQALRQLWVNNCNLLLLPNEIGKLKCLSHLGIRQNKLKDLPQASVEGLENLGWLNCEGNELNDLSEVVICNKIYFINLSHNRLENIPPFVKRKFYNPRFISSYHN